ncbi:Mannan-Binding Lectin Serine Protease 1 [Manis pentadactyla]|nr:Mannan-Binding Lectin Serine Protease 1 [Manis pentadactyla]
MRGRSTFVRLSFRPSRLFISRNLCRTPTECGAVRHAPCEAALLPLRRGRRRRLREAAQGRGGRHAGPPGATLVPWRALSRARAQARGRSGGRTGSRVPEAPAAARLGAAARAGEALRPSPASESRAEDVPATSQRATACQLVEPLTWGLLSLS